MAASPPPNLPAVIQIPPGMDIPPELLGPPKISYWTGYDPSLAANAAFTGLFGISLFMFIVQEIVWRRHHGFSIAMILGSALEVVGYIGRMMAHGEGRFEEGPFMIQIVCLTIAPAFYAAGIYLCLSRIVTIFGAGNSRLPPHWYPRIFIPCDIISLLLQAIGGGMAAVAVHQKKQSKGGNDLMLAGLAFQVATMTVFILFALDFAIKTYGRVKRLGAGALDGKHANLRESRRFKVFLAALAWATLCIFTRCVYRVAELSEGFDGELVKKEHYVIGLEGAVVAAGILGLNLAHPGFCFKEGYQKGVSSWRKPGRAYHDGELNRSDIELTESKRETRF